MATNSQTLLRRVRSAHLEEAGRTAQPAGECPVLFVPAATRDRAAIRDRLTRAGAVVSLAADVPDALHMLGTRRFGLVLVDLAGERTALATIRLVRAQFPLIPVVAIVDPALPIVASEAIYAGVAELLPWPFDDRDVAAMLAAAADAMPVEPAPARIDVAERLFEHSPGMRLVAEAMKAAAPRKLSVLVTGETGSGRQLVARTIHERDHDYVTRPFVVVDCASEGPLDLERRLFGTTGDAAGAPDGGTAERATRGSAVIAAQGGSLLLLHVLDAPARVQARLARLFRDREMFSIDLNEAIPFDVRPMATVGPDVDGAVGDGRLRRDLYERLAQVRVDVPPLRSRREDIPVLAAHFLRHACEASGAGQKRFSRSALTLLSALPWRGNAGELQEVVTAAVRSVTQPVIQLDDLLEHVNLEGPEAAQATVGLTLRDARARFERECISATLLRHHGRVGEAAKALGIQRTNLYRKVRQLNVSRSLLSTARK